MASVLNIRSNAYMALTVDDNGVLYIGTFDGVFIYDGKRVMKVSEKEGLSSDLVYCMTLDRNKEHLWIGTNQGVNRLHLPAYKKGEVKLRTFNKKDGFLGV
jgi:ligand-binding sensor domain-containing protein